MHQRRTFPRRWEGGFSLIELMIVIGLAAVLLSILTLGVRQASDSFALRRAASIAASELRRAQTAAVSERRDVVVEFDLGTPTGVKVYRFIEPPTSTWERLRSISAPSAGAGRDAEWPAAVTFVAAASTLSACGGASLPGDAANLCVKFNLFGEPSPPAPSGQIVLRNTSGSAVRVVVAPATGRVSVER